jgi:cyclohexa-1,5-dienecarbonyl-CoA hydratase
LSVRVERQGRVATVILDRPPLNILDLETIDRLDRAVTALAADPDLTLVVLRGAGSRAFSAGVAVEVHTPDKVGGMLSTLHSAVRRLYDLPMLSVAAVAGHCLGGGMEVALCCDLVIAEEGSRFGQPEVKLGCYPPVAAALFPARLGAGRTLDLLATGRTLTAEECERLGLVTRLVASGGLDEGLAAFTAEVLAHSAPVLRLIKQAVRAGRDLPFHQALAETERLYLDELCRTEDMNEGLGAFLEKRPPVWKHR